MRRRCAAESRIFNPFSNFGASLDVSAGAVVKPTGGTRIADRIWTTNREEMGKTRYLAGLIHTWAN